MAAYFTGGPEIQPDGLHTLYLMNPSYAAYSNPPTASSVAPHQMIFLNSLTPIPHHQQHHQQHFVGIPLHQGPIRPSPAGLSSAHHGLSPPLHHNLWGAAAQSADANPHNFEPQSGPTRPPAQQGLSLSLTSSSPQQAPRAAAGMQSVLMGSKYLKAAQQLLDEVVSVQGEPNKDDTVGRTSTVKTQKGSEGEGSGGRGKNKAADLTTAERQELQMKKAKLVNMLDEVEQRYRQYHQQMQIVGSSFEAMAGFGSARTYTALALHTISKQFRSLRDAISGQIRAIGKGLGEEESGRSGGSRLRFVDHQLRQQRALQQLGMIQHSAWRPQRGLPERAVSVLRAWLFEHFLHPYPKDSDKHLLAKQTGLTRSQVSNWFINARVRLWKPMVEEMYLEETNQQQDHDDENTTKSEPSEHSASKSTSLLKTEHNDGLEPTQDTNLMSFESIMQQSFKKPRTNDSIHQSTIPNLMSMGMKPDELSNRELLMKIMDQGGGFGGYQLGEITRFDHEEFSPTFGSNGVSLTLGLPHCETLSLSGSQQPSYLSNEGNYFSLNNGNNDDDDDHNDPSTSHTRSGVYESIGIQNRKRFAAQLLPDYVA